MTDDILFQLGLTLERVSELGGNDRSRVLNFLLRWEQHTALHACLDVLLPCNPTLVSLADLRIKALLAEGRGDEALPLMQARLTQKTSLTAQVLLARVQLARQDIAAAHQLAQSLVKNNADSVLAWQLLADMELARGDDTAALRALQQIQELRPGNRSYLLGMMRVYQARADWVTASGYAVRVLRAAEEAQTPLPAHYLRQLRAYFQASGETTRLADLDAQLHSLYATELAELQAHFAGATPGPAQPAAGRAPAPPPVEFLSTFEQIPVSDAERERIATAVQQLFGFTELLPGQVETMACVLRGEDVLTILPTGGGKSLCYQLPALLAEKGVTLVISPLIALMKDQLDSLPEKLRARATTINSSLDGDELRQRLEQAGAYRLLYAAPERLRQPAFLHAIRRAGLNRLVVDEAHCVSAWGHDFRPDYLALGKARAALGNPPLLAMTATAPPRVRQDIIQHLSEDGAANARIVAGDITRPNLRLEVFHAPNADAKLQRLLAFCQAESGSGIIYAGTRDRCESLAALLQRQGIAAVHYHAGIQNRDAVQDDFMAGRARVVVATVAFGMGIDKPDIRFIVHFVPPPSLEAYYQEAGRAGRDGLPARCLLMMSPHDRGTLTRHIRRDALSVDFLRAVYAAAQKRLNGKSWGCVAMGDLERDLQSDDTRIRVALSLLEEAALLQRGPDVPRAAQLCLAEGEPQDAALRALCEAVRLKPGQWLTVNLADLARTAALSPYTLEAQLLAWADAGWLGCRFSGRDVLLELLPAPPDAPARVKALLERYETVAAQRVDEITAYARTSRCRHGYLNAYLGGRVIERCTACDNCMGSAALQVAALPDEREQCLSILRCMAAAPWSWGRASLTHILRGDSKAPERARADEGFGALAFRSQTAVEQLLGRLEQGGFIQPRQLEHGGAVLDLTTRGRAALQDAELLDSLIKAKPVSPATAHSQDVNEMDIDAGLFEKLRAWRAQEASVQNTPAYVIFHDSHLRAIAAQRPERLEDLGRIKGIGPSKLEKYGQALLQLIEQYALEPQADLSSNLEI